MKGRIIKIVENKYFGFIMGEDDQHYFFHKDDLNGEWDALCIDFNNNQKIDVAYEPLSTGKGPRAQNVNLIQLH